MVVHVDMLLVKAADVLQIYQISLVCLEERLSGKLRSPIGERKRTGQRTGGGNDFRVSETGANHKNVLRHDRMGDVLRLNNKRFIWRGESDQRGTKPHGQAFFTDRLCQIAIDAFIKGFI